MPGDEGGDMVCNHQHAQVARLMEHKPSINFSGAFSNISGAKCYLQRTIKISSGMVAIECSYDATENTGALAAITGTCIDCETQRKK